MGLMSVEQEFLLHDFCGYMFDMLEVLNFLNNRIVEMVKDLPKG